VVPIEGTILFSSKLFQDAKRQEADYAVKSEQFVRSVRHVLSVLFCHQMRRSKMKFRTLVIVCAIVLVAPLAHAFSTFTWTGAPNADWVTAGNWTEDGAGGGTFVNDLAHATDQCTIGAGDTAKDTADSFVDSTFHPEMTVEAGGTLNVGGYHDDTVTKLTLDGGTATMGSASSLSGAITVTSASTISVTGNNNDSLGGSLSGGADLDLTCVSGNTFKINTNNSAYAGMITFKGGGGSTELVNAPNASATLRFEVGNVRVSASTACDWELDTNGSQVYVTRYYTARTHTGLFTLESDAILNASTDGWGKKGFINGQVTGVGKLTTRAKVALVLGSSLNDYSGGTRVDTAVLEATATGALGSGDVQVDPGTQLIVSASETIADSAELYLDENGGSYGVMNLGSAATVTTVKGLFVGGLGGWDAPVGYTFFGSGVYDASSAGLGSYLTGSGTLVVEAPMAEPAGLGMLGLALLALKKKRS
jgi:hypothetical protein